MIPSSEHVFHSRFNIYCQSLFVLSTAQKIAVFINIVVVYAYHRIATLIDRTKKSLPMIPVSVVTILVELVDARPTVTKIIQTLTQKTMTCRILAMNIVHDQMRSY